MKILIACEFSGIVRDAFTKVGHHAVSCDLLPTERPGEHYQGDVMDIIDDGWDMMIAHPPCTYLANSGLHYLKTKPNRIAKLKDAFTFWLALWDSPIQLKAFENPTGWLNTHWQIPNQIIQPYYFGHNEIKTTCLWLQGLPLLQPTQLLPKPVPIKSILRKSGKHAGKMYNYYWRQGKSAHDRSRTFQGIADAMAIQWGTDYKPQQCSLNF